MATLILIYCKNTFIIAVLWRKTEMGKKMLSRREAVEALT